MNIYQICSSTLTPSTSKFFLVKSIPVKNDLSPGTTKPNICPIVYDRDNCAIANNRKPMGTVIVTVEKK